MHAQGRGVWDANDTLNVHPQKTITDATLRRLRLRPRKCKVEADIGGLKGLSSLSLTLYSTVSRIALVLYSDFLTNELH